jgi:hypothetical protein
VLDRADREPAGPRFHPLENISDLPELLDELGA